MVTSEMSRCHGHWGKGFIVIITAAWSCCHGHLGKDYLVHASEGSSTILKHSEGFTVGRRHQKFKTVASVAPTDAYHTTTGRERLIRSHSSARFCFELSGNSN